MEAIPIPGAEFYYDKDCRSPAEAVLRSGGLTPKSCGFLCQFAEHH